MKRLLILTLLLTIVIIGHTQSKKEIRQERKKERLKEWALQKAHYHLRLINPGNGDSSRYEDDDISVNFGLASGIELMIKNKLDSGISILWNETSIVMPDGTSQKIMHNGVKYVDRGQSMSNTVVPPSAKIEDKLIPIVNVLWNSTFNDWNEKPLFKSNIKSKEANNGQSISVFMPIELPSGKKDYNFKFKIEVY